MINTKTLAVSVLSLSVSACMTVGPDYNRPDMTSLVSNELEIDESISSLAGDPAHDWYRRKGDAVLAKLIGQAFEANRDLRVAAANVKSARAALRLQKTNRRPVGSVEGDASYGEPSTIGTPISKFETDPEFSYGLGLNASWELDFFGRVQRLTDSATASAEASLWLERDVQVIVASETARAYIAMRIADKGISIASANLSLQRETLEITRARLEEGLGGLLDVARAEAQVRATEARIPPYQAQSVAALNRLATLTGRSVAEVRQTIAEGDWSGDISFPSDLKVGDVQSLLQRRADVRAAERALAAATARIGVAKAGYFPRITLVGGLQARAIDASEFGGGGSMGFGIGPSLVWDGFDRPRIDANVAIAEADLDAFFARYEQSVLLALEEVQTALSNYGRELTRLHSLEKAFEQAELAASLARLRYDEGADPFLGVLDSESRLLDAEAEQLKSQWAAASALIAVYGALGAGWDTSPGS